MRAHYPSLVEDERLDLIQRWDPVGIVLVTHGTALLVLGELANPSISLVLVIALAVWRVVAGLVAHRNVGSSSTTWLLAREGGSLVLAAALVAADGGTESPLFFWPLILLAWCALVHTARQLRLMVGITLVSYLIVVIVASDVTTTSMARLGLLLAFAWVLVAVRRRVEIHAADAQRSERLLQEAIDVTPAGLMVIGADELTPMYVNGAAVEMHLVEGLFGSRRLDALREVIERAVEKQETVGPEVLTVADGTGDSRHLRVAATPHESAGSQMIVVAAEDVSHQVEIGEERRSFFRFAGHQLRTPLTPIVAYASMLKSGQLEGTSASHAAEEIDSSARELLRLVERMLSVADLQHGTDSDSSRVTVGEILDQLDDSDTEDLRIDGDPGVEVVCNEDLIVRALSELIENSQHFGEPPVHLEWALDGECVALKLWDEGPGPDPDPTGSVFVPWGKLKPAEMMTPGMRSRLGLVQARLLVSLSGGELTFRRSEDAGWAFVLRLPA